MKSWELQYTKNEGAIESLSFEFEEKPSRNMAAIQLRNKLFPTLIVDVPKHITSDVTEWQLGTKGIKLIDIIEIKQK